MTLGKGRLEAFSDGVLAIIITVMLLELRPPHGDSWEALAHVLPTFGSYALSFIYIAIYWNNHHHMLHTVKRVTGPILWANMFLLFCLSLVPFATNWMRENDFAPRPLATYGAVLLLSGTAYYILSRMIIRAHGKESTLKKAVGAEVKEKLSIVLYAAAMGLSFVHRWAAISVYWAVALMWIIPDPRIEKEAATPE